MYATGIFVANMRAIKRILKFVVAILSMALLYCEFLHYYLVLWSCHYPRLSTGSDGDRVSAMVLADTHLLGPRKGHWFDKLRREWQMQRTFQTAMTYFKPEVVFFLGDLFDEGQWDSEEEFEQDVNRFRRMFLVDKSTRTYVVAGNHDIGFHYVVTPYLLRRFRETFRTKSVKNISIKGVNFVLINSMAFEGDNCFLCKSAVESVKKTGKKLKDASCPEQSKTNDNSTCDSYSRPVLMSHFPLYRQSDSHCNESDSAPEEEKDATFREKWDCISRESSQLLVEHLSPRLVLSGHTHHFCVTKHNDDLSEWTVPSFSWRNKKNPSFLLAKFGRESFDLEKCYMPDENTVYYLYVFFSTCLVLSLFRK